MHRAAPRAHRFARACQLLIVAIFGLFGIAAQAETVTFPVNERYILGPNDGQSGDPICRAGSPGGNYQLSASALALGGPFSGYWVCQYTPTACPDAWDSNGPAGGGVSCTRSGRISTTSTCASCDKLGGPISPATGNKSLRITDYRGGDATSALVFERYYNSDLKIPQGGYLGKRWRHSYDRAIFGPDTLIDQPVLAHRPDGRVEIFRRSGGVYRSDENMEARIEILTDGAGGFNGYRYANERTDEVETYNKSRQLVAIADRAGPLLTLSYSTDADLGPGVPMRALLIRVTDRYGRQLNLRYTFVTTAPTEYRLTTLTDPAGNVYAFAYDGARNLSSVTYPDSTLETYHYEDASLAFALTGITDRNGERHSNYGYHPDGRGAFTELASATNRYSFIYATNQTTFTDPLGAIRTYNFTSIFNVGRIASVSGSPFPERVPAAQSFDANGYPSSRTDWNGNNTCLKFDAQGRELARGEGLSGSCPTDVAAWTPAGATVERKVTTQWDATFRLPIKICEPKRLTSLAYDAKGSLATRTEEATDDAQGALGCSATPVSTARVWTNAYTYGAANTAVATQIVANGPRIDVGDTTTYVYQESTGNLLSVTNAQGHTTSFSNHDAHGRPRTIVDPNGLTTTLTYDSRQRLTSRNVGGETTGYEYDGVGQVTRVTLPDGSFLAYSYDAAHRLTAIADNLGNRMSYSLDAMGNRTREDVFDPGSTLAQTRSRVYSALNRLDQEIGGASPASEITRFAYDNQGNATSVTDPLNRVTANAYDALNRLKQVTDPASGLTRYGHDGLDQLASVTDPRNNATTYTVDGLRNLSAQSSPDTGSAANVQDAAGNLLSSTDAKGQTTSTTYDALNRVTRIVYNQAAGTQLKQVDYGYDQGSNGIGRLTSITETSAAGATLQTTTNGYDPKGRITSGARAIGGVTYTTSYSYDTSGRMTGVTYPSGRTLAYGLDGLGRVNRIETTAAGQTQVVVQDVAYQPFGPARSFTFGNLQTNARSFDLDGRIASHSLASQMKTLAFDAASRITHIEQQGVPTNFADYGYDALDRLTSTVLPTSTYSFGYDAVGNRVSKSAGAGSDTYSYPATSNRLAQITGSLPRTYTHDANGSVTAYGVNGFGYDARGRLVSSSSASGAASYQVNALGQRVRKTSSVGDTVYHYDTQGRLIAESSAAGVLVREYVWLGDQPVALLVPQLAPGTEVIVDNSNAGFSTTGTWPASTAVAGYLGANYQTHEAGGPPPGAIVVDNTDAGFSTLGTWPVSTAVSGYQGTNYQTHAANGDEPSAVVVDNPAGSATGTWPSSTSVAGYLGANYQTHAAGTGTASFTWTGAIPQAGDYRVYARWTTHANRATDAKYTVVHSGGQTTVTVNQQQNGATWNLLGTFTLGAGSAAVSLTDQANGFVIADAVKWVPVGAGPNTATWTPTIPAAKDYRVYARWTAHPNRASDAKYTVTHDAGATTVTVNQQQNAAVWNLLGTFRIVPGAGHRVSVTDQANGYVIADAVRFDPADGPSANTASWNATLTPGQYQVYARWTAYPNRATDAKYTVTHASGQSTVTVNQQQAGGAWNLLGTFSLTAQGSVTLTDEANGFVIADAVRLVPLGGQQTGSSIYYVHADHLNTPRAITNQQQQLVWRWENQEPFGNNPPEENPSGLGNFEFPLRLPGQFFDRETGLAYNGARDFDPVTGRYLQSDPIGLAGGINTFGYANQNPLRYVDPSGLFLDEAALAQLAANVGRAGTAAAVGIGSAASVGLGLLLFPSSIGEDPPLPSNVIPFPKTSSTPKEELAVCPAPGGPKNPCGNMRDALERLHRLLSNQTLSSTDLMSVSRFETLKSRRDFNENVDLFNQVCVPLGWARYTKRFVVGPRGPAITGTPTLHDFYGR